MINKLKIVVCLVFLFLFSFLYVKTNKEVENYQQIYYNINDTVVYNDTDIVIKKIDILRVEEIRDLYGISENLVLKFQENYGDAFEFAIYTMNISNSNDIPSYFDFSHFTIEVEDWVSWTNMKLFNELNTQLNNKSKVCIYPGIKTEIVLPFLLYHDNDKDNFIYKQLSDGNLVLNLGIYPVKYCLNTKVKNFEIEEII